MSNIAPPQQRYWKERYAEMLEMPSEKAYGVAVENEPEWDPLTDPLVIRGPWRPEDLRQAAHILEWDRGGIGMDPNISDRWLYICGVLIDGGLRRTRSPEEARESDLYAASVLPQVEGALSALWSWVMQAHPDEFVDWLIAKKTPGFEQLSRDEWRERYREVLDTAASAITKATALTQPKEG